MKTPKTKIIPATTDITYSAAVKSLSKKTTEKTLFSVFKSCGKIETDGVTILRYEDGTSKRIGFVNFVYQDGLTNALSMNGRSIDDSIISVETAAAKKEYEPLTDCQFYMKEQCTKEVN